MPKKGSKGSVHRAIAITPYGRELLDAAQREHEAEVIARCAAQVPTNWLDPLLTGPTAVLSGNGGTWGCREIEALLRGVQDRIRALKAPSEARDR